MRPSSSPFIRLFETAVLVLLTSILSFIMTNQGQAQLTYETANSEFEGGGKTGNNVQ